MPYFVTEASSHCHCHCRCCCLPLATTTTTIAPWLHCRRLHCHCIVISTAITTVFPLSSVIYLIVMSLYPLPFIAVRSSSFFTHFITISPRVPPSFVDCCFKRRTKPLLPTMVLPLSSWPSALVGCFCCPPPPPPTLAASHVRCCQQSVALTSVALTLPSPCPPLVVATPPAILTLCGVLKTLAVRLAAGPYNPPPLG